MSFAIDGVHFSYGTVPVLSGVSLAAATGETVALLGRNGAGKTTVTRLLVALLHPTLGSVRIAGESTVGKKPEDLAHRVAYVFQHPDQQLFGRTVLDEVAFGPAQRGVPAREAARIATNALARIGIGDVAAVHPFDLPLPRRKLVTIAAAVAQDPRVLVLDEPTQGLDRAARAAVATLVRELASDGVTVLAVTHDLAFVAEALERIAVLVDGAIGVDESAHSLITNRRRVEQLGLRQPEAVRVSEAMSLPGSPMRVADVVRGVRQLAAGSDASRSANA